MISMLKHKGQHRSEPLTISGMLPEASLTGQAQGVVISTVAEEGRIAVNVRWKFF